MRFLIYGINFAPELTGIGKYTGEMARYLAQQGHSVRVVTAPPYYPDWKVAKEYSPYRYEKEIWEGVEVLRCPLYVPKKVTGVKRLLHLSSFVLSSLPVALAQVAWRPDVVFAVAPAIFSAPIALLTGKLAGSKTWLHIQDFELEAAFNLGILKGGARACESAVGVECGLLKSFDCVSTISRRMIDRLCQKGVEPHKRYLFPNWADTDNIFPQPGTSALRKALGIAKNKQVVLYSGNMGRKQGIEILVQAAQRLRGCDHIHFLICGEGVAKADLVRQAAGLENITFQPLQPLERLNDLLNLADIHVLPQRADAADLVMPSKLTGMFASGRPVVATASPGTELYEVVSKAGIAVPPENVEALSQALASLAADREKRVLLGRAGREYVEKNWSKNRVLQRFVEKAQSLRPGSMEQEYAVQ